MAGLAAPRLLRGLAPALPKLDPQVPSGTGGMVGLVSLLMEDEEEMAGGEAREGHLSLEEEEGPRTSSPPPRTSSTTKEHMLRNLVNYTFKSRVAG